MTILTRILFGSHLYGTSTENSDTDYKAIYMPSFQDLCFGRVKKNITTHTKSDIYSKNTAEDVDIETFSLQYFIQLACEGQTIALDMLHATKECTLETSEQWEFLVANRSKFYTRSLNAFVRYANDQAAKYGIKGSRLNTAKRFIEILNDYPIDSRMREVWNLLPVDEHAYHVDANPNGIKQYQICGKVLQESQTVVYAQNIVANYLRQYGARAELAAENKGVDWKAISHAYRAALQVKEILTEGTITFPLKEAPLLLKLKLGEIHANTALPMLEEIIAEVKELSAQSTLPEEVDKKFWEDYIVSVYRDQYIGDML